MPQSVDSLVDGREQVFVGGFRRIAKSEFSARRRSHRWSPSFGKNCQGIVADHDLNRAANGNHARVRVANRPILAADLLSALLLFGESSSSLAAAARAMSSSCCSGSSPATTRPPGDERFVGRLLRRSGTGTSRRSASDLSLLGLDESVAREVLPASDCSPD